MSSTGGDWRGLVPSSNDPMLRYIVAMQKAFIRDQVANSVAAVDSDNEDIYAMGQDVDTVVRLHDELSGVTYFPFNTPAFPPFEPDGNQVKLWVRGNNLGHVMGDMSNFNNVVVLNGDPVLVDGTIDLGTITHGVKSVALRLNRPTSQLENQEWIEIRDSTALQVIGLTTGFSIFVRVRFNGLLAQQEGRNPTIFEKIDDSTPNNAMMLVATPDRRLRFAIKTGGVVRGYKETATLTIVEGNVYDIWVTFGVSGSVINLYVNGVNKTLTDYGGALNWQTSLINHNLFIGRRGAYEIEGFAYMDFYDLKYYRDRVVTQAEVTNHYNNKWTISAINFGQVMIVDHYATYTGSGGLRSFSSGSFSPGSFSTHP